jgi:hypothetical protein
MEDISSNTSSISAKDEELFQPIYEKNMYQNPKGFKGWYEHGIGDVAKLLWGRITDRYEI